MISLTDSSVVEQIKVVANNFMIIYDFIKTVEKEALSTENLIQKLKDVKRKKINFIQFPKSYQKILASTWRLLYLAMKDM